MRNFFIFLWLAGTAALAADLKLPQGWRIVSSHDGAVTAEGPEGGVDLGYTLECVPPNVYSGFRPACLAPFGDIAAAIIDFFTRSDVINGFDQVEKFDAPAPAGQVAQFVRYKTDYFGQAAEVLTLAVESDETPKSFKMRYSQIRGPEKQFARSLPVLWEIWKSWKADDQQLDSAARGKTKTAKQLQKAGR